MRRQPGPGTAGVVSVGLVAAGAGAATVLRLGRQPLWYDEIATARASSLPWAGLRALLQQTDANLGTYYALQHLLGGLGHSPALLRLPSALATVGTVVLTARVGRRLLGPGAAVVAAALVAVHPFATAYARDARPYALVECCCTGALLLGLRAAERPSVGRLTAYASVGVAAVFLHLYAVLPLGAYALALLPAGTSRRRWLLAQAPALAAGLGLLVVSLAQSAQLSWVPALSVAGVLKGLLLLCGGVLPMLALLAGGAVLLRDPALPPRTRRVITAGLVLPVGALLAASTVSPTFVPRYLVATVPLQCLVVAGAAGTLLRRSGTARLLAPVLLVAVSGWFVAATVAQDVAPFRYEDYRGASRALLADAQRGDAVVYEQQGARLGLDYYLPRVDRSGVAPPADVLVLPGATSTCRRARCAGWAGTCAPAPSASASSPCSCVSSDPAPVPALERNPMTLGLAPARSGPVARPPRRRRPVLRALLTVLLVLAVLVAVSIGRALTAPGTDSTSARLAEWGRGHGLSGAVDEAERLTYKAPATGGAPTAGSPLRAEPSSPSTRALPRVQPFAAPALPDEGVWSVLETVRGRPALQETFLRPDAVHTSYTAGLAWMDPSLLRFVLHPGTVEPGGAGWSTPTSLGPDRTGLVAAFNGGFRLDASRGGFYADGRTQGALRDGAASLVIDASGTARVGQWGRDLRMGPDVVAVRQNLDLLVDGGQVVSGLADNTGGRWGKTLGNRLYVFRSGIGQTAGGALVYAAGNGLSAATLAGLLVRAGAVRAMELDINPEWTSFVHYPAETNLLPDMQRSPRRYDTASSRDFIAVLRRS